MLEKSTLKIDLVQMEVEPGRPDINSRKIIETIDRQRAKAAQIVVFPEMAVPGYMIGDRWGSKSFLEDLAGYDEEIAKASEGVVAIWGNVHTDFSKKNRDGSPRKYNAAHIAQNGRMHSQKVFKTNLPTYRQFHDSRYFSSLADFAEEKMADLEDMIEPVNLLIDKVNTAVGVMLCEDMWWQDYGHNRNVADILQKNGADLIVNLSCSPWGLRKNDKRHRVVAELFSNVRTPFLYVNNVGSQDIGKTVLGFDGGTTAYGNDGKILSAAKPYAEDVLRVDYDRLTGEIVRPDIGGVEKVEKNESLSESAEIKKSLIASMKAFCERNGITKVVNGLSGGIDSAVTNALWVEVLGAENVFSVNMPTKFNSGQTRGAALEMSKSMGVNYAIVPIQSSFDDQARLIDSVKFSRDGGVTKEVKLNSVGLENVQARIRGSEVLAGIAAALGAVVSCNGNKTEMAFGYATLYGDTVGALAPIGDLLKGQVFDLARQINKEAGKDIIPTHIIENLKPSAELSEAHNVDKGLGDPFYYDYHDAMVKAFVEYLEQPEDLLQRLVDGNLEEKWKLPEGSVMAYFGGEKENLVTDLEKRWKEMHRNVFKRYQTPPVIKVSSRAFGYDFHESQNQAYFSKKFADLKAIYLANKDIAKS